MKRLRRILIALSLLVCFSTAILWLVTLTHPPLDFFTVIRPTQSYGLGTERGGLIGFLQQEKLAFRDNDPADIQFHRAGFRVLKITSNGMRRWNVVIPVWTLTLLTFAPPLAVWLKAAVHRRRRRRGQCPACLYDLTGNVSGVCPECGRTVVKAG